MVDSLADTREVVGSIIFTMKTGAGGKERGGGSWVVRGTLPLPKGKAWTARRPEGGGRGALMSFLPQTYKQAVGATYM